MKKLFAIIFIFFILLMWFFTVDSRAGTAYYCDLSNPGVDSGSAGTHADPFVSLTEVNNESFSTGDDVYFKQGETYTLSADADRLTIDWTGTSGDRVIIGCYEGDGDFECSGARPIIDGDTNDHPGSGYALVTVSDPDAAAAENIDYITIQDLKIQYSGHSGIRVGRSDYINVDNCYLYRNAENGIVYGSFYGGVNPGVISNNTVENSGYPGYTGGGAAIEVYSGNVEGYTQNITVEYNTVFSSKLEGIGLYKNVTDSIVQYNTVYDIKTFYIYIGSSRDNIVRHNLVYGNDPNDAGDLFPNTGYGIAVDNETFRPSCFGGRNDIYGNMVASLSRGISLGCGIKVCTGAGTPVGDCTGDFTSCDCFTDTRVYNNTLIDNDYNIQYWDEDSSESISVVNNISRHTGSTGQFHFFSDGGDDNIDGMSFTTNMFNNNDDTVGGEIETSNLTTNDPGLVRTATFLDQAGGTFDQDDFKLSSTSSEAYGGNNAGTDLGDSYDDDYWGNDRDDDPDWSIGAAAWTAGAPPAGTSNLESIVLDSIIIN